MDVVRNEPHTGNARGHSLQRQEVKSFLPSMVSLPQGLSCVTCLGQNSRPGPDVHEGETKPSPSGVTSHTW